MKLSEFLATWRGTTLENRVWRIAILLLAVANLVLVGLVGQVERTVVLVPPVLEGEVTIAREYASQEVEESWGLYVAELLGNVSPATVDALTGVLEPLLAGLRRTVMKAIAEQTEESSARTSRCTSLRARSRYDTADAHRLRHRPAQDRKPGGQASHQRAHLRPAGRVPQLPSAAHASRGLSRRPAERSAPRDPGPGARGPPMMPTHHLPLFAVLLVASVVHAVPAFEVPVVPRSLLDGGAALSTAPRCPTAPGRRSPGADDPRRRRASGTGTAAVRYPAAWRRRRG